MIEELNLLGFLKDDGKSNHLAHLQLRLAEELLEEKESDTKYQIVKFSQRITFDEASMIKNFSSLKLFISHKFNVDVDKLTTIDFFQALEMIDKEQEELKKLNKK